jgi:hypothetical protein
MSEHIDRLCGELRIKLHGMDRRLEALKGNAMAVSEKSQHAVESQLDRVEHRIYDNRVVVEAANARVKAWLEGKKASFDAGRAAWKANRRVHELNARADDAEAYAGAVFALAAAAADEATQAALEALLARNDANVAAMPEDWVDDDEPIGVSATASREW